MNEFTMDRETLGDGSNLKYHLSAAGILAFIGKNRFGNYKLNIEMGNKLITQTGMYNIQLIIGEEFKISCKLWVISKEPEQKPVICDNIYCDRHDAAFRDGCENVLFDADECATLQVFNEAKEMATRDQGIIISEPWKRFILQDSWVLPAAEKLIVYLKNQLKELGE